MEKVLGFMIAESVLKVKADVEEFLLKIMVFREILLHPVIGENWEEADVRGDIIISAKLRSIHLHPKFSGVVLVVDIDGAELPEGAPSGTVAVYLRMEMIGNQIIPLPAGWHPDTIWDGLAEKMERTVLDRLFFPRVTPFCKKETT